MRKREIAAVNGITEGVIWKQLLYFFFPILLGTFFQQMYNTVDAVVVGQYVGTEALAAVGGTAGTLINLLVGFFVGLSSGATVIIAQFWGSGDKDRVSKTVHTGIAMSIAGGAILMVIGVVFAPTILGWMNTPEDVIDLSAIYVRIYCSGMIPSLIYNVGSSILRAVGDAKRPLYFLIVCCLANIVLDLFFVLVLDMGVAGVGIATVLSQVISAVLVIVTLLRSETAIRLFPKKIAITGWLLKDIVRIGLPAGFQSVLYSLSNIVVQTAVNAFGTTVIAAYTAYGKMDGLFWMIIGAFGVSITTFVGQNFGARRYDRVKRCTRVGLLMALGTTIVLSALLFVFREPLLRFFTGDDAVVRIGANFFMILAPSYFTFVFIEIFSGAIRGAGEALQPMLITCFGVCGLRILWLIIAVPLWPTMEMVAMNYPATWVVTAIVFIAYYARFKWLDRCIRREHDPSHVTLEAKKA